MDRSTEKLNYYITQFISDDKHIDQSTEMSSYLIISFLYETIHSFNC